MAIPDEFNFEIGHVIRHVRLSKGLTPREAAKKAGIFIDTYYEVERGVDTLHMTTIKKVTDALGIRLVCRLMDVEDWELWRECEMKDAKLKQRSLRLWYEHDNYNWRRTHFHKPRRKKGVKKKPGRPRKEQT